MLRELLGVSRASCTRSPALLCCSLCRSRCVRVCMRVADRCIPVLCEAPSDQRGTMPGTVRDDGGLHSASRRDNLRFSGRSAGVARSAQGWHHCAVRASL